jgi:phenylalanyl-tRNA synthetase alpha chain
MQNVENIVAEAVALFAGIDNADALEQAKARYLGKAGTLTELLKGLGKLEAAERKTAGALINDAKGKIEAALNVRREAIRLIEMEKRLAVEALDVTLPGRGRGTGGIHPLMRTLRRVEEIFGSIGFDVADGPEIDTDWYNFTALNNPENHPARSSTTPRGKSRRR